MSYSGPPPTQPPPRDWRPPTVGRPEPPRVLPPQDHAALDAREHAARRLTLAVGTAAGVVMLVVACLLLGRLVI